MYRRGAPLTWTRHLGCADTPANGDRPVADLRPASELPAERVRASWAPLMGDLETGSDQEEC